MFKASVLPLSHTLVLRLHLFCGDGGPMCAYAVCMFKGQKLTSSVFLNHPSTFF